MSKWGDSASGELRLAPEMLHSLLSYSFRTSVLKSVHTALKRKRRIQQPQFWCRLGYWHLEGPKFITESTLYDKAGEIGKALGLEWGGDFSSITDKPHFQCKKGKTMAELRKLKKEGKEIPILG
jgi:hypothetical protein